MQYRTKLYIVRHDEVAFHVFYQQVLQQFGETRPITLQTPLPVYDLVLEALKNPRNGYDEEDGPREQLADEIKTLLIANGPMLFEYFSLDIDSQGMLRTLPQLLPDHEPSIHSLPEFVFHLATEVNWEEEEPCFESVAQALARWYGEMRYLATPSARRWCWSTCCSQRPRPPRSARPTSSTTRNSSRPWPASPTSTRSSRGAEGQWSMVKLHSL